ncbi:MAG: hypothetical protein KIS92_14765 [Planctomycetota bacterium]|nr:hypothetical protein [Planctomycetota bacterium]
MVFKPRQHSLPILLACAAASVVLGAADVHTVPPKADLEALVAQLRGDDPEARDAATKALGEHALELWDKLLPLAGGDEPEVRARVRSAMTRAAVGRIPAWIKDAEKDLYNQEKFRHDFRAAVLQPVLCEEEKALKAKLAELERAEAGADEARRAELAEEKKRLSAEASGARNAAYERLRAAYLKREAAERKETLRLRTRLFQLYQLRADREVTLAFRPDMQAAYDPKLLPFEKRLGLTVCYECLDETFAQAMARIGAWAGIEIVIAPEVSEEKRIRALADQRVTEQDVRSLAAGLAAVLELDCRVDAEAQRITILPRGR